MRRVAGGWRAWLCAAATAVAMAGCGSGGGDELGLRHVDQTCLYTFKADGTDQGLTVEADLWLPTGLKADVEVAVVRQLMGDTVSKSLDAAVERYLSGARMAFDARLKAAKSLDGLEALSENGLNGTATVNGRLLVLGCSDVSYQSSAAHPGTVARYANIDTRKGRLVTLADVLKVKAVGGLAKQAVKELPQNKSVLECAYPEVMQGEFPEPDAFYLSVDGMSVCLVYQQYSIASYACGLQVVEMPFMWLSGRLGSGVLTAYGHELMGI